MHKLEGQTKNQSSSEFNLHKFIEKFMSKNMEIEDLIECVTDEDMLIPVLSSDGDIKLTKSIYLDNAATLPILKPVSTYAKILEDKFRSNVGRSYGYKETVMRFAYSQAKVEALNYFGADKNDVAVLGSNVTTLFLCLFKHIKKQFPDEYFLLSPLSHSALLTSTTKVEGFFQL